MIDNPRLYGSPPYRVAVVHGGPGAPGEMRPVALGLSGFYGVMEPLQTALSLEGQLEELYTLLVSHGEPPLTLIGHSWGAWLAHIVSARYPEVVGKLVLVGAGPYTSDFAAEVMDTRLSRLSAKERQEAGSLARVLNGPSVPEKERSFRRLGELFMKSDSYDPVTHDSGAVEHQYQVFQAVWPQAAMLRDSGRLIDLVANTSCQVVAIHGEYDPHPFEGVTVPLSSVLNDLRFIMLAECGHYPWLERKAGRRFHEALEAELSSPL
jgi:pimeloyl-ACP methyl ester carboxylesterase